MKTLPGLHAGSPQLTRGSGSVQHSVEDVVEGGVVISGDSDDAISLYSCVHAFVAIAWERSIAFMTLRRTGRW